MEEGTLEDVMHSLVPSHLPSFPPPTSTTSTTLPVTNLIKETKEESSERLAKGEETKRVEARVGAKPGVAPVHPKISQAGSNNGELAATRGSHSGHSHSEDELTVGKTSEKDSFFLW